MHCFPVRFITRQVCKCTLNTLYPLVLLASIDLNVAETDSYLSYQKEY